MDDYLGYLKSSRVLSAETESCRANGTIGIGEMEVRKKVLNTFGLEIKEDCLQEAFIRPRGISSILTTMDRYDIIHVK